MPFCTLFLTHPPPVHSVCSPQILCLCSHVIYDICLSAAALVCLSDYLTLHPIADTITSFLFMAENLPLCIYRVFSLSSPLLLDNYQFHCLAIVSSAAINTDVKTSLWCVDLGFLGKIPRSEIAGSHDQSFLNLRNLHPDFHSDLSSWQCPRQCLGISFYPFFIDFLMTAVLTWIR